MTESIKYSLCATTYNVESRLRKSLDSILRFINPIDFEIVVVDSESKDGTTDILKEYQNIFPNIKIIEKKCKRGLGRQISFENSIGEYIVQIDLDTLYSQQWIEFIKAYENWECKKRYVVQACFSGIFPRHLLEKVGGWRNLQWAEDIDLWWRLIKINSFKWCPLIVGENWEVEEPERRQSKNILIIVWRKFINEKDRFIVRSEYSIRNRLKEVKSFSTQKTYWFFWIPIVIFAKISSLFYRREKRDAKKVNEIWMKNMIDFDIEGTINYNFIKFPER